MDDAALNKSLFDDVHAFWKSLRNTLPELANYKVKKKGCLEYVDSVKNVRLTAHKGKYGWSRASKPLAVEIAVGLRWPDEALNTETGWSFRRLRLSERGMSDRWWALENEGELATFRSDVPRLLSQTGIPFIQQCSHLAGACEWMSDNEPPQTFFKHCISLHGAEALATNVKDWLRTQPRSSDRVFDWLEQSGIFEPSLMNTYKTKSWQSELDYQAFLSSHVETLTPQSPR